ncbi:hypothetical protein Ocin01_00033 [Orchesella cincta]|uniref:Uncharacterized protein n=1 Tax=Orchesella cincta TaxID=48709 RepID=A0A1D2NN64_ORCCI|nr:hypothetical protein Ocin01_00033 [Orchesella cincta]
MSRNKPLMASTPASVSKAFPGQSLDQTMNSQVTEGDLTIAPSSAMDQTDGDFIKFSNRTKNSNWKRVKATLSRSQSQIVELFNRTSSRSKSRHTLNRKTTDFQTNLPDEPTLLSVHKKPTTPIDDGPRPKELVLENVDDADAITAPDNKNHRANYQHLNTIPRSSRTKLMEKEENFMNSSSPHVFSGHSRSRLMNSTMPSVEKPTTLIPSSGNMIQIDKKEYEELLEKNRRLKQEYDIVWEDNRMLSLTFEDAQTRLKYFQDRNKYLEMAMYQEGKVLTDIIRACHEEIAILKDHECELLGNREDNFKIRNVELKIREYYMNKYANADETLFSDKVSGFSTTFLENLPEGIAE